MTEHAASGLGVSLPGDDAEHVFRDALQLIAEGVTEMVRFKLATISVVRSVPDGGQVLEVIADAGDEATRDEIMGRRTPLDALLDEVADAEVWGNFRFLPFELLREERLASEHGWVVPDIEQVEGPDAWHPMDLLVALLHDADGVLRGTLAIDVPVDGRRPGPDQRRTLDKYAELAGQAIVAMIERERLTAQGRLADTARSVVRNAKAEDGLESVLAHCQEVLVPGFRASGAWIQTFGQAGPVGNITFAVNGMAVDVPDAMLPIGERSARIAWELKTVRLIARGYPYADTLSDLEFEAIIEYLDSIGVASMLFVPIGAGSEALGHLVLTRGSEQPMWSEVELASALDIGHDLGRVILNARTFEREHQLVHELRALDAYKSQLIATVSHELKSPLTSVIGYLEILESVELSETTASVVASIERGAQRMQRVVEDLLVFSQVGDPEHALESGPVDCRDVINEVVDLVKVNANRKDIDLEVLLDERPPVLLGDREQLVRVATNLVGNAVKYTPEGGHVRVFCTHRNGRAHLEVSDTGLGISPEDQKRLFTEFFRSTNPEALRIPGTGLGLAIVHRLVERHGGTITVKSALGEGSTFTLELPLAGF